MLFSLSLRVIWYLWFFLPPGKEMQASSSPGGNSNPTIYMRVYVVEVKKNEMPGSSKLKYMRATQSNAVPPRAAAAA